MKQIIYDLSLLQAMRGVNQAALDSNGINPATYVYKKYKVDSLQFAKSDQYYAVENIKHYEKMYAEISEAIVKEKTRIESELKKETDTTKILERKLDVKAKKDSVKQ
jgi:DNA polymerase II small subunit/DNA polymerase delta subunit B